MKLLYAEDERSLSEAVVDILTYHKYIVDAVYDGEDAYAYALSGNYDGVILDVMMPGRDGIDVLSALRKNGYKAPILLLTAKTQVEDRIRGLDAGADDYLPKPFDDAEHPVQHAGLLEFVLPKQEYRLMEQLMANHNIFLSTEDLLVKAWGYDAETDINSVWLYISYLRKRLAAMNSSVRIVSKRNIGYRLENPL